VAEAAEGDSLHDASRGEVIVIEDSPARRNRSPSSAQGEHDDGEEEELDRGPKRAKRTTKSVKNQRPKVREDYPTRSAFDSIPDHVELDLTKKRSLGFASNAAKAKSSASVKQGKIKHQRKKGIAPNSGESDHESSSGQSGNESEAVEQGCAMPPNFNADKSDDPDSDSSARKSRLVYNKVVHKAPPSKQSKSNNDEQKQNSSPAPVKNHALDEFETILSVHASEIDGSCLFDSLSSCLGYILEHHPSSFNFSRFPLSRYTIRTLCDRQILRNALCDHVKTFSNDVMENLGNLTPRAAVLRDYVDKGTPLYDPEWYELLCAQTPAPLIPSLPRAQTIASLDQYVEAMRKPRANGDEIMIAAFCNLLNLRVLVSEVTAATAALVQPNSDLMPARVSLDILPALPLSSDFTCTLILSDGHYDWSHLTSGECNDPSSHCVMRAATSVVCYPNRPVSYVDMDPDYFTPVCAELTQSHKLLNRRTTVKRCLIEEHDAIPSEAELTITTFERLGGIASMTTLPELLHLHAATTYKPTDDGAQASLQFTPGGTRFLSSSSVRPSPSKLVKANNFKRANGSPPRTPANMPSTGQAAEAENPKHAALDLSENYWKQPIHEPEACSAAEPPEPKTCIERVLSHVPKLPLLCKHGEFGIGTSNHVEDQIYECQRGLTSTTLTPTLKEQMAARERVFREYNNIGHTRAFDVYMQANKHLEGHVPYAPVPRNPYALPYVDDVVVPNGTLPEQPSLNLQLSQLCNASNAVQLVTNCPRDVAQSTVERHFSVCNNFTMAVALSCQEIQQVMAVTSAQAHLKQQRSPVLLNPQLDPRFAPQAFNTELSFIEQHLGEGVREMTSAELSAAEAAGSAALKRTSSTPPLSALVPRNLSHYWKHHVKATADTPKGSMTAEQHSNAIRRAASTALHYQACDTAAAHRASQLQQVMNPPTQLPASAAAQQPSQDFQTPLQRSAAELMTAQAASATNAALPSPSASYQNHASPAVRKAELLQEQAKAARSSAATVIVMSSNSSKLLQWKGGEEKDCKGFYWSTKLAVQQAWEQYNTAEDIQSYRTFKSAIHCTMLPIICAELVMTRAQFETISDAELIDRIDKKLKPTGPADYLIKMRQIKFDTTEPNAKTLLHRYRAFAEPFLQLLAEATDSGCPINEESIKLAFKEQCKGNNLMMMWLTEERWSSASNAHHRIMVSLKNYDTLMTLQSLSGNGHGQAAIVQINNPFFGTQELHAPYAPANPSAPQALQQPKYTREQRAEYQRQQQANAQRRQSDVQESFQPRPPPAATPSAPTLQQHQVNPLYQPAIKANNAVSGWSKNHGQQQANMAASPQQIPAAAYVNYNQQQANMVASPQQAPATACVHPGLDSRGPYWHPIGCKCRYTPCTSPLCQGCGEHGHDAANCKKRNKHANWNYSGYYAEQRPGQAPLIYDGPPRQAQFAAAPNAQQNAAPAFPTPHHVNPKPTPPPVPAAAARYTPVVRANVASQHSAEDLSGSSHQ
jgi:hypothetical protein